MTLRVACPQEAPVLARLHGEAFAEGWSPQDFEVLLETPGVFGLVVAAGDGSPGGLVLMRTAADEAEVLTLAVVPGLRRRGLGRILMDGAFLAVASRGVASVFLEVAVDNVAALDLYRAAGFTEVGRRPKYYGRGADRVDALVMRRNLNRSATSD